MDEEKNDSKLGSKQSYRSKIGSPVSAIGAGHLAALSLEAETPSRRERAAVARLSGRPEQSRRRAEGIYSPELGIANIR